MKQSTARTECVEVLFNEAELDALKELCKALGIARSAFLRGLAINQVQTNGKAAFGQMESRGCRGGRPASRASAGRIGFRSFSPSSDRKTFGGALRPIRV